MASQHGERRWFGKQPLDGAKVPVWDSTFFDRGMPSRVTLNNLSVFPYLTTPGLNRAVFGMAGVAKAVQLPQLFQVPAAGVGAAGGRRRCALPGAARGARGQGPARHRGEAMPPPRRPGRRPGRPPTASRFAPPTEAQGVRLKCPTATPASCLKRDQGEYDPCLARDSLSHTSFAAAMFDLCRLLTPRFGRWYGAGGERHSKKYPLFRIGRPPVLDTV